MSNVTGFGVGTVPVRGGEVRHHANVVKPQQAANVSNKDVNPATVVTQADSSAADNNLGKLFDMKT